MQFAIIEAATGKVINVVEWDGDTEAWQPPEGCFSRQSDAARIGDIWDGAIFTTPAEPDLPAAPIPTSVTMRQARLALLAAGQLKAVSDAINGLPSPQKEAAQIEWDYAATVDRASPFLVSLATMLQLDDPALDELFTAASQL